MNKIIIVLIFFVIVAAGVGAYLYFYVEKPIEKSNEITYYNISLKTIDKDNSKQVSTAFYVVLDAGNLPYINGTTTDAEYLFIQIPTNRTFTIYTANKIGQRYYTSVFRNNDLTKATLRIDLLMTKYGTLNISQLGSLGSSNPIYVNIDSNGTFQGVIACVRWSSNFIRAFPANYSKSTIPKRLVNKVDACYDMQQDIINQKLLIPISYQRFGMLSSIDYINIYIVDSDNRYYTPIKVQEDTDGKDIGAEDQLLIIKNI